MRPKFKAFLLAFIIASLLTFMGCATPRDLETLQRDMDKSHNQLLALQRNIYDLNMEIKNLSGKMDSLAKRSDDLRAQMSALGAETKAKINFLEKETRAKMGSFEKESKARIDSFEKEMETTSQPMRRYQADLGARLDKLQMDVQNLLGRFEESKYFAQRTFGETKTLKESYQGKFDELDKRIWAMHKTVEDWGNKVEDYGKKVEDWGKKAENLGNKVEDWGKKVELLEREAKANALLYRLIDSPLTQVLKQAYVIATLNENGFVKTVLSENPQTTSIVLYGTRAS
ncbi:MAG: hypothetical protein HY882_00615, partial [Deltaproteobacteria bacterium]|nr:hypothetical protein [Deltaproteobacteria bacterium]